MIKETEVFDCWKFWTWQYKIRNPDFAEKLHRTIENAEMVKTKHPQDYPAQTDAIVRIYGSDIDHLSQHKKPIDVDELLKIILKGDKPDCSVPYKDISGYNQCVYSSDICFPDERGEKNSTGVSVNYTMELSKDIEEIVTEIRSLYEVYKKTIDNDPYFDVKELLNKLRAKKLDILGFSRPRDSFIKRTISLWLAEYADKEQCSTIKAVQII
jgi:hypothetical protein